MEVNKVKKYQEYQFEPKYDLLNQLLLVVIATTVITIPFIFDSFTTPKLFILAIGLAYISIRVFNSRDTELAVKIPYLLSALICLFITSILISWVASGVPVTRGFIGQFGRGNGVFYYFFVILIFTFSIKTFKVNSGHGLHELITLLSWFMAFYAGLQRLGIDIAKLDTKGMSPVVLTFGNSNFAGGLISVLFAYHLTYLVISRSTRKSTIALLIALLISSTFAAAFQGYMIILFSVTVAVSIKLVMRYPSIWVRRGVLISLGLGLVLVAIGVFGKFLFAGIFARNTFQIRVEYWKIALNVISDFPLLGVGPDKLFDVSGSYMAPGTSKIITGTRLDNAHNWFLNIGVNYGLIALFSLLAIFGWVFLASIRLLRNLERNNAFAISSMIAFLCMFIDSLVSLEQPGIGVWLYFFGGVTVGAYLEAKSSSGENRIEKRMQILEVLFKKILPLTISIIMLVFAVILGNRIYFDGVLRSNVQKAFLNKGTSETFSTIESASLRLQAEPEYAFQSLKPLAAIGDEVGINNISKAFYDYYPKSIQASLIRADVLRALNRSADACSLRSTLIKNTPWDFDQVNKYVDCQMNGYSHPELIRHLKLAARYFSEIDRTPITVDVNEASETSKKLLAVSIQARVYFLIGQTESAKSLQVYGDNLLARLTSLWRANPTSVSETQLGYIEELLEFN